MVATVGIRYAPTGTRPRVEYRLSPLGASLVDGPMRELGRWVLAHGDELQAARERTAESDVDEAGG
jgi:DNA-binding HxlR family transcriptional regulator